MSIPYRSTQVLPATAHGRPPSKPIPACIADFANIMVHQVSAVLDGVRDAVSGLTESIESSQSMISGYQQVILEEKDNVRIVQRNVIPIQGKGGTGRESTSQSIISLSSTSSPPTSSRAGRSSLSWKLLPDADVCSPLGPSSYSQLKATTNTRRNRDTSVISLTSSSSDKEVVLDQSGSDSESSSSSVSPQSMDEDGDSDSMVSSDGLTNTSDEEDEE